MTSSIFQIYWLSLFYREKKLRAWNLKLNSLYKETLSLDMSVILEAGSWRFSGQERKPIKEQHKLSRIMIWLMMKLSHGWRRKYIDRAAISFGDSKTENTGILTLRMYLIPIYAWKVWLDIVVDSRDSVGYFLHYGFFEILSWFQRKSVAPPSIVFLAKF